MTIHLQISGITIWKLKVCEESIFHRRRSRQQHEHVSQHNREVLHEERLVGGGGVETSAYLVLEMKNTKKFMALLKHEEKQMILKQLWSQGPKMRVARRSPGVAQYRWVATTEQNIKKYFPEAPFMQSEGWVGKKTSAVWNDFALSPRNGLHHLHHQHHHHCEQKVFAILNY